MNRDSYGANAVAADATVPTADHNRVAALENRPSWRVRAPQHAAWLVAVGFAGTYLYLVIHFF